MTIRPMTRLAAMEIAGARALFARHAAGAI